MIAAFKIKIFSKLVDKVRIRLKKVLTPCSQKLLIISDAQLHMIHCASGVMGFFKKSLNVEAVIHIKAVSGIMYQVSCNKL